MTVKAAPPGWEAHKIRSRLNGWVVDPNGPDRVPTAAAELIARAAKGGNRTVATTRARMIARHNKVLGHV
ncbi:hypothetical protein [Bradyrhizobium sp. CCBAU 53380]|uniref:hypothetical protein n=1 Tax=Bradyrhizobium sp. CCBAU 53380 TaxID=1325117 RepID=UPI0023026159|nr:hypothetical protein [Bradyrhizobium sp. CCBAU 53380]